MGHEVKWQLYPWYIVCFSTQEPFNKREREYSYFAEPLIIKGGIYTMCWCGPPPRTWAIAPGQDYRIPDGRMPTPCPSNRPDDGGFFLSPAGQLHVIGPEPVGGRCAKKSFLIF